MALPNFLDTAQFAQILLLENPLKDRRLRVVPACREEANLYEVEGYFCQALGYDLFDDFLRDPGRTDLVYISDFGLQPVSVRQAFFDFLRRWSNAFHGMSVCSSMLLVVSAASLSGLNLPSQDTHLRYRLWRAIPSVVEARLLCRLAADNQNNPETQWREVVLPSLAGSDLDLLDWLWEYALGPLETLKGRLTNYHPAHWNGSASILWKDLEQCWSQFRPLEPANLRTHGSSFTFWGAGFINETPEYGREIHPTLLMQCNQETKALRRLWRGQAALILPMIDEVCLGLDDLFTRSYRGREWIWYVDSYNMETKPPLEMRDFQVMLDKRRYDPRCKGWYQRWHEDVKRTRELRNSLAHGTAVAYEEYRKLYYLLERVRSEQ